MAVAYLGPIAVVLHGTPAFQFTGDATANGMQPASFSGVLEWDQGKQLKELVDNPHRRQNPSGVAGVLEPIWSDDALLADFNGWYVMQQCQLSPQQIDSITGLVPFTLTATRVSDRAAVVATRSARARANDFGVAAQAVVANPFHDDDIDGSPFVVNPGGARFTRAYDARHPHDMTLLTPAADDARAMTLYANPTAGVVYPALTDSPGVPDWVTKRGGDCRFHDRTAMRDVYGPHPFAATSDTLVTNGLIRAWVGSRLLPGYLHVEAFDGTTWRELGTLLFGSDRLLGLRMSKVTPDVAILKLTLERRGEVVVSLQRGETKFNLELPSGVIAEWSGVPPTSRANVAQNGTGKFGTGLDAGGDADDGTWSAPFPTWSGDSRFRWTGEAYRPDIRLLWPPDATPSGFSRALWYRPERAVADLGTAGLLTLYGPVGQPVVEVYIDGADQKLKVRVNDVVKLATAAQAFGADTDLLVAVRYSNTTGLALSVRNHLGAVVHLVDATITDLGVDVLHDAAYFVNFSRWGDGAWGDGVWAGLTHYPGGAVDNDRIWRRAITDAEFVALAAATGPHDALPAPDGDCVWYAPYDAQPLPTLPTPTAGLSIDPVTDANGFTKAIAYLDSDRTKAAAIVARARTFDTAAAQQKQLAATSEQSVRVA